nr:MAG TPA: hypothetical protein [Caudoviricetes sp.]
MLLMRQRLTVLPSPMMETIRRLKTVCGFITIKLWQRYMIRQLPQCN